MFNFETEIFQRSKIYNIILIKNVYTYKFVIIFGLIFNIFFAQENVSNSQSKDSIKIEREKLEDVVHYKAQEITNVVPKKVSYLIKDALVNYQDIKINADFISIDWETGDVFARSTVDSLGKIIKKTTFEQGGKSYKYDSFKFNFKNKQGVIYNAQTIERESIIDAKISKKINDSIYYMRYGRMTTDEYYIRDEDSLADYYIYFSKAKYIKSDKTNLAIAGPSYLAIEQVPTPLAIPFLLFPLTDKRTAGIIIPSYGDRDNLGFYLQGGGFYVPIGETFDLLLTGDFYTKGSWGLHSKSQYRKIYKYNGNFAMDFEHRISGIKGMTSGIYQYSKQDLYRISWTHSQDSKANPYSIFSASVNFTSSKYYQNSINNANIVTGNVLNSSTSSSINWTKTFENFPMNFSVTGNYTQNLQTEQATLTAPTFSANLRRQYPLRKDTTKNEFAKSFYIDYRMQASNSVTGKISEIVSSENLKNAKNGMKHTLGIGTGTTLFDFYPITFSANYDEVWSLKTITKYYDYDANKVVTENKDGFSSFRTFNTNVGISSTWYGQKNFKKEGFIQAIRHTITPTISYNFTPDFSSEFWNYYEIYRDNDGRKNIYSKFEGGLYGSPSSGLSNSIGISIANNLEMKVRTQKDSVEVKKIKIFDYFNVSTSYNIAADSLNWSPISLTGATSLFNSKLRVNYSASVNPYKIKFLSPDATYGYRSNDFGTFSVDNYNIGLGFGLDNDLFGEKTDFEKLYKKKGKIRYDKYYFDDENYARFSIPWKLNFSVNYNYNKGLSREASKTASVALSGNISPSPYWQISGSTNYDVVKKEFAFTQFTLSRDLRSFTINFTWVPFGLYKTWDFFIGIKASILSDAVKYQESDFSRFNNNF